VSAAWSRSGAGPLRLRAAQCREAAGRVAGGGRVLPAAGCCRDRGPCLPGAGGRAGDPWAGLRRNPARGHDPPTIPTPPPLQPDCWNCSTSTPPARAGRA